jgi:4-amino-4-deoxy-L-arabinose transferase-like glycosyltransferase
MSSNLEARHAQGHAQGPGRVWLESGLVALAAFAVMLVGLGSGALPTDNDALYADVIRTMVRSGNWLDPEIHGVPFLDKPPLFFWLGAVLVQLGGESLLLLRLPAALCGALLCGLMYLAARRSGLGRQGAALAVVSLLAVPLLVAYARRVYMEVPVALCVFAAVLAFQHAISGLDDRGGRPRFFLVAGVLVGLAFMLKSLVALFAVFPLPIVLGIERRWQVLRSGWLWLGAGLAVLVAAPWHAYELAVHRDVFMEFTYRLHVEDQVLSAQPWSTGPAWFYLALLATDMPFLGVCTLLGLGLLGWRWARKLPVGSLDRHLGIMAVVTLLVLSTAETKKDLYVLVIVPPVVLLFARMLALSLPRAWHVWLSIAAAAVLALGSAPYFLPSGEFLQGAAPLVRAAQVAGARAAPDRPIHTLHLYFSALQYYAERPVVSHWTDTQLVRDTQRIPYIRHGKNMRHVAPEALQQVMTGAEAGVWMLPPDTAQQLAIARWAEVLYEDAFVVVADTARR